MLPDPRTPAQMRQLVDQLASIASEREQARALAKAAGFPTKHIPEFKSPIEFWSAIVEQASHGRMSLDALLDEAIAQFPHNLDLQACRVVTNDQPNQTADRSPSPLPASSTDLHGLTAGPARGGRGSPGWREGLAKTMLGIVLGAVLGAGLVWSLLSQRATEQAVQATLSTEESGGRTEAAPPASCSPVPTTSSSPCTECRHRIGVGTVQRCIKTLTFLESNSTFIKGEKEWKTKLDELVGDCGLVVKSLDGP